MAKRINNLLVILLLTIIPTLAVWAPFFFKLESFWGIPLTQDGMATIVANYDGPLFLVVAKTFYNPELIKANFQFTLPTEYYAAHFPLFPLLIRTFSFLAGYPYSMLIITVASSFLALYFFHKLIKEYVEGNQALWLTFVISILPARWLIARSVGSAEPLFIASIIASVFYFRKRKYFWAGIWGMIAQLTKSPGILLFVAYILVLVVPKVKQIATTSVSKWVNSVNVGKIYPIFLIPLSLLGLFIFYAFRYGDFFAYFRSGDNIHLFFPPFQIFNYNAPWVGTFWLEEIILVYLFGILGLIKLVKLKEPVLYWFYGVFFFSTLFVSHRDLIRYSLPLVPFLFVAFSEYVAKKEFRIVMAVLIIPIYLFSLAFISQNVMQISDWGPFL